MAFHSLTAQRSLPPLAAVMFALAQTVLTWEERRNTRRALRRLDATFLTDIGVTARMAQAEGHKAFWLA